MSVYERFVEVTHQQAVTATLPLSNMDDATFVRYVRDTEARLPEIANMIAWRDGVRKELDMRLLLKK
jgi:hypothetical protein